MMNSCRFRYLFFISVVLCFSTFFNSSCTLEEDTLVHIDTVSVVNTDTLIIHDTIYCNWLLPTFILTGQDTGLGIHYETVNVTLSGATPTSTVYKSIDLNSDGINDIQFQQIHVHTPGYNGASVKVTSLGNAQFVGQNTTGNNVAAFINGSVLDNSLLWTNNSLLRSYGYVLTGVSSSGLFSNTELFIGVKLVVGSTTRFAWVSVYVANDATSVYINDFACTSKYCL